MGCKGGDGYERGVEVEIGTRGAERGGREGETGKSACAYTRCHRVMIADSMMDWLVRSVVSSYARNPLTLAHAIRRAMRTT